MNKVNLGKMKASACKELDGHMNDENNCMVEENRPPKNMQKPPRRKPDATEILSDE